MISKELRTLSGSAGRDDCCSALTLRRGRTLQRIALPMAILCVMYTPISVAQSQVNLEEMEQRVERQRVALQQAIAEREATAAKVAETKAALEESEKRKARIRQEMETLCEQQESLQPGSLDDCLAAIGD